MGRSVSCPGILSVIVALNPGEIRLTKEGRVLYIAASDGYAQIEIDNAIVVTGSAEWPEQIDLDRANLALQRAEEKINSPGTLAGEGITRETRNLACKSKGQSREKTDRKKRNLI